MRETWLTKEHREKTLRYLKRPLEVAAEVGRVAEEILGSVEVFVFGSVVEGDATLASDLDILVVSPNVPESSSSRSKMMMKVLERIGMDSPVELHMARPEELDWYRRFSKRMIRAYPPQ